MPARQTELNAPQTEILRLVALGLTNTEISQRLHMTPSIISRRLQLIGRVTGTGYGDGRKDPQARIRLVAWAYRNGLMDTPSALSAETTNAAIRLALDILSDRPRGDLRARAMQVCEAAGVRPTDTGVRRGRPVAVPAGADDEQAA